MWKGDQMKKDKLEERFKKLLDNKWARGFDTNDILDF